MTAADVVTLARAHVQKFAAHQGNRADDSRGAPWSVAIETARVLGLATRELAELRAQVLGSSAAMNAGSCATCRQPLQLLSDGNGVLVEMCGCGLRRIASGRLKMRFLSGPRLLRPRAGRALFSVHLRGAPLSGERADG